MSRKCTVAKTNQLIHVDALLLDMTCEVIYETLSTARFNRVSSDFSENILNKSWSVVRNFDFECLEFAQA